MEKIADGRFLKALPGLKDFTLKFHEFGFFYAGLYCMAE